MGIYDRDYNREPYGEGGPLGIHAGGPLSLTTKLVLVLFGVYVLQLVTQPSNRSNPLDYGWLTNTFMLHSDLFRRPWLFFELLTYGFLHDVGDIKHILFNCLAFWIFGRAVEQRYGQREYIAFFLAAIVFAGLTWLIGEWISRPQRSIPMLGASGGIAAVLLLYCLNFPRQNIYIWGVFPLPAWLFAILFVGQDLLFAVQRRPDDHVAFLAHLGGAGFAVVYFKFGLRLAGWLPDASWLARLRPRPKLRVRFAEDEEDTDELVDEILQKIQEHGQDSLTRRERQILERASREYQKRRK